MNKKKWYLALALLAATSGCAGLEDCRYERVHHLRACSEFRQRGVPECERFPRDYKAGFLDGFYEVSTGGPNCPPAVAPAKYRRVSQVLGDCDNRRHSYYSGWQDGAARASCYPDTHSLRMFESCDCQLPRCEGCCTTGGQCNSCGVQLGSTDPGMIHGEWSVPTPTTTVNDPTYSGDLTILPTPIVDTDDHATTSDDDDAEKKADENGPDAARRERRRQERQKEQQQNEAEDAINSELQLKPDDAEVPSPSDLIDENDGASVDQKSSPQKVLDQRSNLVGGVEVTNPATVATETDRSIDIRQMIEVATAEVPIKDSKLVTNPALPLDRTTIQAMFGIDQDFDFHSTGTVSYQADDPVDQGPAAKATVGDQSATASLPELMSPTASSPTASSPAQSSPAVSADQAGPVRAATFNPASSIDCDAPDSPAS